MVNKSNELLTVERIKQVLGLNKKKKTILNKRKKEKLGFKNMQKISKTKKEKKSILKERVFEKDKKMKKESRINKYTKGKKDYKLESDKKKDIKLKKVCDTKNKKIKENESILSNPLCDTCINISKVKDTPGAIISLNAENWKEANMHIPLLGESNKNKSQEVHINLGPKYGNRLIYYFGAKSINKKGVNKYPMVYNNSTNNGLVVLDKDGKGIARVDCPTSYLDVPPKTLIKKGNKLQSYMNHIHMLVSDKKMSKWEDKMFTQNVLCKISKAEYDIYNKIGIRLIINALESKYDIPGTDANILYKTTANLKGSMIRDMVKKVAINKSEMHKNIVSKCNITNIPLLVYCHNPKCTAAKSLAEDLYRAGFYNILYYPDGYMGYYGRL